MSWAKDPDPSSEEKKPVASQEPAHPPELTVETDVLDVGGGRLRGRVVIRGELDVAATDVVEDRLRAVLAAGASDLIVDTTDVTFLDSSGLRVLVHVRNRIRSADGTFLIDGMSPAVQRVLELCGMLDLGAGAPP